MSNEKPTPAPLYAAANDIRERIPEEILIQLTDDPQAGEAAYDIIEEAIKWADAIINGFCSRRYKTPMEPPPPLLCEISADLAAWHLYARRQDIIPEYWARKYELALRLLDKIAAGEINLEQDPKKSGGMLISAPPRIFTDKVLAGF